MKQRMGRTVLGMGGGLAVLLGSALCLAQATATSGAPTASVPRADSGEKRDRGTEATDSLFAHLAARRTGGLTADQVAVRAESTSFDVKARQQALIAAESRLEQAIISFLPRLTLQGRYTRLSPITPPSISLGPSLQGRFSDDPTVASDPGALALAR